MICFRRSVIAWNELYFSLEGSSVESIFYPEVERRKLGITDEEMENIVAYFQWQLDQINKRRAKYRLIELLKIRSQELVVQKKLELERDLELLKSFSNLRLASCV